MMMANRGVEFMDPLLQQAYPVAGAATTTLHPQLDYGSLSQSVSAFPTKILNPQQNIMGTITNSSLYGQNKGHIFSNQAGFNLPQVQHVSTANGIQGGQSNLISGINFGQMSIPTLSGMPLAQNSLYSTSHQPQQTYSLPSGFNSQTMDQFQLQNLNYQSNIPRLSYSSSCQPNSRMQNLALQTAPSSASSLGGSVHLQNNLLQIGAANQIAMQRNPVNQTPQNNQPLDLFKLHQQAQFGNFAPSQPISRPQLNVPNPSGFHIYDKNPSQNGQISQNQRAHVFSASIVQDTGAYKQFGGRGEMAQQFFQNMQ
ncbi:hypothetical protein FGO68_gene1247 [Halteria grandinella]|uniref:Uncharacterized protein n=1 Tax=Halteria grandinella TaxID=5974 RepID=A0A8J8SXI5_HALGN|nr:hypothetical protein FGO68_gene1247 [Halteria grandinella]